MAGTIRARSGAREMSIGAVVLRCGCGAPDSHPGAPCPRPRAREDRGVVAYYHKHFWRRWLWQVGRFVRPMARIFSTRSN